MAIQVKKSQHLANKAHSHLTLLKAKIQTFKTLKMWGVSFDILSKNRVCKTKYVWGPCLTHVVNIMPVSRYEFK